MLSRDAPAAKTRGNNSPYPTVRSRNVDAEAVGRSPSNRGIRNGGQMGNNSSAGQEGPYNQSAGRAVRAGAADQVRTEREPNGAVAEPSEGGAGIMEGDEDDDDVEVYAADEDEGLDEEGEEYDEDAEDEDEEEEGGSGYSTQHEMALLEQFDKEDIGDVSFDPDTVSRDEFLRLGQGGATIAGNNYEGVIEDRVKLLSERMQDGFRWAPDMGERLKKGEFVDFKDEAEKQVVQKMFGRKVFEPVSEKSQAVLVDRLVRGKYGDLNAKPHQQDLLNHVARATLKNGTYLEEDGSRFLKKVRSLLPAQAAARPPPKAARK